MFYLTKEERLVVSLLVLIIASGSLLQFVFKRYPHIRDMVNIVESDAIYHKVDLNTASIEELKTIPYIGQYTASNIVTFRTQHGAFTSIEEVKRVKGIRDKNYERFSKFLYVKQNRTNPGG